MPQRAEKNPKPKTIRPPTTIIRSENGLIVIGASIITVTLLMTSRREKGNFPAASNIHCRLFRQRFLKMFRMLQMGREDRPGAFEKAFQFSVLRVRDQC